MTWKQLGNIKGPQGASAYESWLALGNTGTLQDFIDSLQGIDGKSAYQAWLELGNAGTEQDFLDSLVGNPGDAGPSAYQVWLSQGNSGTEADFLAAIKGDPGDLGASAYEVWVAAGNSGTEQDFLDSLVGSGEPGGGMTYRGSWAEAPTETRVIHFDDGTLPAGLTFSGYPTDDNKSPVIVDVASPSHTKALKSPALSHGYHATYTIPFVFEGTPTDEVTFQFQVSSEANYDKFIVTRNDTAVQVGSWSGIGGGWRRITTTGWAVGNQSLSFKYQKDGSGSHGDDAAYLSELTYVAVAPGGYALQDVVIHDGQTWVCKVPDTLEAPGDGTDWELLPSASAGGGSVATLSDVDLTNIADGQVLVYDSATSTWKAEPVEVNINHIGAWERLDTSFTYPAATSTLISSGGTVGTTKPDTPQVTHTITADEVLVTPSNSQVSFVTATTLTVCGTGGANGLGTLNMEVRVNGIPYAATDSGHNAYEQFVAKATLPGAQVGDVVEIFLWGSSGAGAASFYAVESGIAAALSGRPTDPPGRYMYYITYIPGYAATPTPPTGYSGPAFTPYAAAMVIVDSIGPDNSMSQSGETDTNLRIPKSTAGDALLIADTMIALGTPQVGVPVLYPNDSTLLGGAVRPTRIKTDRLSIADIPVP